METLFADDRGDPCDRNDYLETGLNNTKFSPEFVKHLNSKTVQVRFVSRFRF